MDADEFEEMVPPPLVDSEDEDSDEWESETAEAEIKETTCLFCPLQFDNIALAIDHCRTAHNFDLSFLKAKFKMDCYSYVKMINYIRLHKPKPEMLINSPTPPWIDDCYLKPGEMESWLTFDFDGDDSESREPSPEINDESPSGRRIDALKKNIQRLMLECTYKELLIKHFKQDAETMKQVVRAVVDNGDSSSQNTPLVVDATVTDGTDYFNTYSHYGIHYEMLNDKPRTHSYRDAILNNSNSLQGKVVLDLGCGTGILSMFCAKAGADHVIGVDQSDVIYKAMDIVKENSLQDKIVLIRTQIEKTNLPVEKVDVIVSEWMGYFLLFEGMLDSVIYARDKYLAEGGLLLPNRCRIVLFGVSDQERYDTLVNFWDNVYGFSMKCMKSDILREASVEVVPLDKVFTNAAVVADIDIYTCTTSVCNFKQNFVLTAVRDGVLTSVGGYFDTFFDLPNKVELSTGPHVEKTHWQQTVFYLKEVVVLKAGQSIKCSITCSRLKGNVRGLGVLLSVGASTSLYVID